MPRRPGAKPFGASDKINPRAAWEEQYRPAPRQRRSTLDEDGFVWMVPSPTAWPDVRPDGNNGRPPGPRTQVVGYNKETQTVRTVFRDGTTWAYHEVPPEVWEQMSGRSTATGRFSGARIPSTGRFINSTLNNYPYGPESFTRPA